MHICVIPGDGIGGEVIPAALAVLRATGLPIELTEAEAGWQCFQRHGTSLPDATLAAARAADAILFGAVASPSHPVPGYRSPIVTLRRALDLYANIRPVLGQTTDQRRAIGATANASAAQALPIDLVVVRENTEGLYAGRERVEDAGDTAIAERVITRHASERIVRMAFELARRRAAANGAANNQFPQVTIVHKANVLRETCGLFRRVALEVAQQYPEISHNELLVDNCALQLVQRPEQFNVIVTTNLFGDILSDVACYWGGGLGIATSANLGQRQALFEPVHGAAPDIAGQGSANPLAAIGCVALLLDWLGQQSNGSPELPSWATRINNAIALVLAEGPHTPDLGGSATTDQVVRAVIAAL
ncbi:MAG: isocitrate/isopropylmalate dehydrogenase family protein [Roseiflexaceae bacterium]|nr:isocitrate/isopropylmalate dehydrogenase family protein [Roseiflexaceae bacterium]